MEEINTAYNQKLFETTQYLFNCNYDDPDFDDEDYNHSDAAAELIDEFGWAEVFNCWFDYLKNNCPTPEDVINFANLFFYYGGA